MLFVSFLHHSPSHFPEGNLVYYILYIYVYALYETRPARECAHRSACIRLYKLRDTSFARFLFCTYNLVFPNTAWMDTRVTPCRVLNLLRLRDVACRVLNSLRLRDVACRVLNSLRLRDMACRILNSLRLRDVACRVLNSLRLRDVACRVLNSLRLRDVECRVLNSLRLCDVACRVLNSIAS